MQITEKKFTTRKDVEAALLEDCLHELSNGTETNGQSSMLLSGGTTPGNFYKTLSTQDLDWKNIWFGLSDERWVNADHPDSNALLVQQTLLQNNAANAHFIGLKSDGDIQKDGWVQTQKNLADLPKPFDIVLLGMGTDGHTASLFPDSKNIQDALSENNNTLCQPIDRGEGETLRMSMTLNALLNAKEIKLFFFGDEKLDVYNTAKAEKNITYPVSYILHQDKVPVTLYWTGS